MKLSLAASVLFAATTLAQVDPIVIKGSKFFYKTNGTQFFMRGVAYQQGVEAGGATGSDSDYTDPLADTTACKRDIEYLKKLRTNTIRVYAIDPKKDHKECMEALQDAGIYVVADLSEPKTSINRDDPEWNTPLFERYTSVIDEMALYSNTLGFFAGNEVSNQKNNTFASAFVKAAVRDSKSYIKSKGYRQIGVGYATNDDADIRENLANFFDCGDRSDAIDFWGYNIYSWCGNSSFKESGFDVRTKEFAKYNVPVFFAEYGCNTMREENPPKDRLFTEVGTLYGDEMNDVWSGGIVYMYNEEANKFGLVEIKNGKVEPNGDFDNLSKEIAKATPTGVKMNEYSPTNTAAAKCPSVNSDWGAASDPLPPVVNAQACSCMMDTIACDVDASVSSDKEVGSLFGVVCGMDEGKYCAGINRNHTVGPYGAYGMCTPKEQLAFALNAYYKSQNKAKDACDFKGSATLKQAAATAAASCGTLLQQAGEDGTGTLSGGAAAAETGAKSGSGSPGAAAGGLTVSHVSVGYFGIGAYLIGAVASGAAMILL
ncbi:1,3-beta-glucanosyltransferase gel4 precursor [Bimuria novae-zelandiae CBS 107.79]|uniref:1,3-beta-glucanosyltransferase n=1 Tax=Bimuria novae-zelandiae CBS 107.79 TaxID=1447943 RepID=A0A6A5VIF2_9PLEO|nr:1,3-beta-glucanosyltransferase gel4 precursor [Bimuria novae-zelandiae CBS 107.79]